MSIALRALPLLVLLAVGCARLNGNTDTGPAEAVGDTPVRFVICNAGDKGCFVDARFADFESCERHNKFTGMWCDEVSKPGHVICGPPKVESFAVGHCTK